MDINVKYKKILEDLYSSEKGLLAFTLYSRYSLSPTDAIGFIEKFKSDNLISVDEDYRICLTAAGKTHIAGMMASLLSAQEKDNRYLISIESTNKIKINEPYLPDRMFYDKQKYMEREAKETSK